MAVLLVMAAWTLAGVVVIDGDRVRGLLPWAWWLVPVAVGASWLARRGFWLVPAVTALLPWSGFLVSLPAIAVWTGPPVIGLVILTSALAIRWRLPRAVMDGRAAAPFAAVLAGVWLSAMAIAAAGVPPSGDEPHYLMTTTSLIRDGDLAVENNYFARQYLDFYPGELGTYGDLAEWHLLMGRTNRLVSVHAPGVAVLALPGFWLAGVGGARAVIVLIASIGAGLFWCTARRLSDSAAGAWIAWAALVLSAPFAIHGSRLYPDGPAAAAVIGGLWLLVAVERDSRPRALTVALVGAALAGLVWLHVRLALPAAVVGLAIVDLLARRARRFDLVLLFLAFPLISALWLVAWTWLSAGTLDPSFPFSGSLRPDWLPGGLLGLLADQEFGLLVYAPVSAAAVAALPALWSTTRRTALTAASLLLASLLLSGSFVWWGGFSPPGRFLVPVLPGLALGLAAWWPAASFTARELVKLALAFGASVTAAMATVDRGRRMINDADGRANLLVWLNDSVDLTQVLPSLFPPGQVRGVEAGIAAIWVAIGLGVFSLLRSIHRRSPAPHAAGVGWTVAAFAVWVSVASMLTWTLSGRSPWTPERGDLQLLHAASRRWLAVGYQAPPPVASSLTTLLSTVDIVQRFSGGGLPTLHIPFVPAGRYRATVEDGTSASVRLDIGDGPWVVDEWPFPADEREFTLAVPVRSLRLSAATASGLRVEPIAVDRQSSLPDGYADHAGRFGSLVVYLLGPRCLPEAGGFWTARDRTCDVVVVDLDGEPAAVQATLEAGPSPVDVRLERPGWQTELSLGPLERKEVVIPGGESRDRRPLTVSVRSASVAAAGQPAHGVWLALDSNQAR
jgi:hypothetical protein